MFFKPKKKDVKWYFKGVIRGYINEYSRPEANPLFADIYNRYIESKKDENLDEAIKVLPKAEQRHKELIEKLIAISNNNSVFLSNKEETELFNKKNDLILWDKIYTQDIIKTLPLLIAFVEVHSVLMDSIYNGAFVKVIISNELLWSGLHPSDDKYFRDVRTQDIKKRVIVFAIKLLLLIMTNIFLTIVGSISARKTPVSIRTNTTEYLIVFRMMKI